MDRGKDTAEGWFIWQTIERGDDPPIEVNAMGIGHTFPTRDAAYSAALPMVARARDDEQFYIVPKHTYSGSDWDSMTPVVL